MTLHLRQISHVIHIFNFSNQSGNYGCDHDTETHQWILYETQENSEPAKIIKKFRYKFL